MLRKWRDKNFLFSLWLWGIYWCFDPFWQALLPFFDIYFLLENYIMNRRTFFAFCCVNRTQSATPHLYSSFKLNFLHFPKPPKKWYIITEKGKRIFFYMNEMHLREKNIIILFLMMMMMINYCVSLAYIKHEKLCTFITYQPNLYIRTHFSSLL